MLYLLVTMEPTGNNLHGDYSPYVEDRGVQHRKAPITAADISSNPEYTQTIEGGSNKN